MPIEVTLSRDLMPSLTRQQGDVLIYQAADGGELAMQGGVLALTGGFESAVYLSLFGGNRDDDGREQNRMNWWGNLSESNPARQYRSETQYLILRLNPTSGNLLRIEDAMRADLGWFLTENIVSDLETGARIPRKDELQLNVVLFAEGDEQSFSFTENWRAQSRG